MGSTDVDACVEKLKILNGLPPHNHWGNICAHDGYFANSIKAEFSAETYHEAVKRVQKIQKAYNKANEKIASM